MESLCAIVVTQFKLLVLARQFSRKRHVLPSLGLYMVKGHEGSLSFPLASTHRLVLCTHVSARTGRIKSCKKTFKNLKALTSTCNA